MKVAQGFEAGSLLQSADAAHHEFTIILNCSTSGTPCIDVNPRRWTQKEWPESRRRRGRRTQDGWKRTQTVVRPESRASSRSPTAATAFSLRGRESHEGRERRFAPRLAVAIAEAGRGPDCYTAAEAASVAWSVCQLALSPSDNDGDDHDHKVRRRVAAPPFSVRHLRSARSFLGHIFLKLKRRCVE